MTHKSLGAKKTALFVASAIFFISIYTICVYKVGVDYGRKMQVYLSSPTVALEKMIFITRMLKEEERMPDCITELFLTKEVVAYKDSLPGWEKIFFSNLTKKNEFSNEKILGALRNYRTQYPLTEAYYEPCKDNEYLNILKERNGDAWNYIMMSHPNVQ
jgi:hypothetical protein